MQRKGECECAALAAWLGAFATTYNKVGKGHEEEQRAHDEANEELVAKVATSCGLLNSAVSDGPVCSTVRDGDC